jgi:integrase
MAKLQLTWMPGTTPRWRKKYQGGIYYFSGEPSKTASYKTALAEWAALKEKLDQDGDPDAAADAGLLKQLKKRAKRGEATAFIREAADTLGVSLVLSSGSGPELKPVVDKFLAAKRAEVDSGQVSGGRYDNLRRGLEHFAAWHGERLEIDGNTVPDYKVHCLKSGNRFAHDAVATLKQFIRFCWKREIIDQLPRTFDETVSVGTSKPKTWNLKTFRQIYQNCPERLQLYLLLQINCGMYSGDVSDLSPDEINWSKGTITRSRSKTPDNEPTTWKLWPETLKLLKKFRTNDKSRVLLTETGRPLNVDELREDGKRRRCDSIRQDYIRWCAKNGISKPPTLKELRKTGASLIAGKFTEAIAEEYLGHRPRTVARKHYLAMTLDDALAWLRQEVLG